MKLTNRNYRNKRLVFYTKNMKLNSKIIKIKAQIISPIHIDNWEVLDRLDYFCFYSWDEIQVLDRKWLNFCAEKDLDLFKKIIFSIENWDFKSLENLKQDFYENYIEDFLEKYEVKEEINIWDQAKNYILQDWNKNNVWEIKRFSRFWINKEIFIPWSSLKGIFRTIFLFEELNKINWFNYKDKARKLENINKNENFKKELFAFLQFEDVKIENQELEIQEISMIQKPKKFWKSKKWVPQILETVIAWNFEIIIKDLKWQIDINNLKKLIENYSNILVAREEKLFDNTKISYDFLDILDEKYNSWIFPIKIWMHKKSGAYKIFWEELLEEVYKKTWKDWLKESRRLWVWDKTIYLDENNNPVWWIWLGEIEVLDK